MNVSQELIEQIVRRVMRATGTGIVDSSVSVAATRTLQISSPVISEQVLESCGAAGCTISLCPGAVITPSGRDYLRRHSVRVATVLSHAGNQAQGSGGIGSCVIIGSVSLTAAVASAAGWPTHQAVSESAAAALIGGMDGDQRVVCAGGEASLVACLLNRNSRIRAAVVSRSTGIPQLLTAMNPNILCLESCGWSFGELLRLLRTLSAAASPMLSTAGGKS